MLKFPGFALFFSFIWLLGERNGTSGKKTNLVQLRTQEMLRKVLLQLISVGSHEHCLVLKVEIYGKNRGQNSYEPFWWQYWNCSQKKEIHTTNKQKHTYIHKEPKKRMQIQFSLCLWMKTNENSLFKIFYLISLWFAPFFCFLGRIWT